MTTLPPIFPDGKLVDVAIHKGGSLAVEDSGPPDQPAVSCETIICLPGMGDLRQQYRFLAPLLHSKGHRVLVADLRGMGDSSVGFPSYTPVDVSNDALAIIHHFNFTTPVIVVGNSLAGASVIHLAATQPKLVKAVIGLCPIVRDPPSGKWFRIATHVLFVWPWGVPAWIAYFNSLFKKSPPSDLADYEAALKENIRESGRISSIGKFGRALKEPCFQVAGDVKCPALLIFGEKDPDYTNPLEEAHELEKALLHSKVKWEVMAGLGHYPHVEDPEQTLTYIIEFLGQL